MNEAFNQSQRFVELWTEMATKMAAAGMAVSPDSAPPQAAREARAAIFQTMSKHAEEAMRSPQFLEMMKQSLDGSLQFREQLNDFLTRLHHQLQGVARQDIDSVLAGIHQLERRVLDRLEGLDKRFDEVTRRLEALENSADRQPERAPTRQPPPKRNGPRH